MRSTGKGGAQKGAPTTSATSDRPNTSIVQALRRDAPSGVGPSSVVVTAFEGLPGTDFCVNAKSTRWKESVTHRTGSDEFAQSFTYTYQLPAVFNLTPVDVRRWHLAREAMDQYRFKKPDENLDLVTVKPVTEMMETNRFDNNDGEQDYLDLLGFALVMAGYAGLHGLAWNGHFPSHGQQKA